MFENLKYHLWAHVKDIFSTVNFFENSLGYLSECDIKLCKQVPILFYRLLESCVNTVTVLTDYNYHLNLKLSPEKL